MGVNSFAQRGRASYHNEISFYMGPAFFKGDVSSGVLFSGMKYSDIDKNTLNFNLGMGICHHINNRIGLKSNVNLLQLSGNDKWGENEHRGVIFKTHAADLSMLIEYSIVNTQLSNSINSKYHFYISSGITFFYFKPMGQYQGKWHNLQELGTEGQGIKPNSKKYSLFSFSIPMNIGYRIPIDRKQMWGVEFCFRKTFTDYIDDVSTVYYNNVEIAEKYGAAAAYFANPGIQLYPQGLKRGNSYKKDNYSFINFTYSRFIGVPYSKFYNRKVKKWKYQKPIRM